jgi:adenosine deaminase
MLAAQPDSSCRSRSVADEPNGTSDTDLAWFQRLPKVELHLHLEGAIPHDALWELLKKYGGDPNVRTKEDLARKFVYRDFPHFLQVWTWMSRLLREYEDFEFIATEVARDLARQNIRYVEAFYSAADFLPAGLEPQRLTEAIRNGLKRVADVEVALIADLVRDYGPERGARMLAAIKEVRGLGVIGVGIGGSEHRFPPQAFAEVYRQAREMGFKTTAHAGEAAGPDSIWGAIRTLEVDRIGHGTRAIEDPRLMEYLAEKKIPVELCVISNVKTGVIADAVRHPARTYFERGILLSINTDDPKMFGNSLADECLTLHRQLGFSRTEIVRLIEQGIESSWLSGNRKVELLASFRREFVACGDFRDDR